VRPGRSNVLLPKPGFAQYALLLNSLGAEVRYYELQEEKNWEVDLDHLEGLIDDDTKAILLVSQARQRKLNDLH
jgi:tyrosine aminotransferase